MRILFTKTRFVLKHVGIYWLFIQRWVQFKRLMTNTSVLPSIFLAGLGVFVSIGLSIVTFAEDRDYNLIGILEDQSFSVVLIFFILFALFILSFGGRYFFTSQTPKIYADYSIQGREISAGIIYISYCIWKECIYLLSYEKLFEKYHTLVQHNGNAKQSTLNYSDIKKVKRLQYKLNYRQRKIERIDYMIVNLAKSMNVPANRLSDYLFQFSPSIYKNEIRRLIKNMREVLAILDTEDGDIRRARQARQVDVFVELIRKRQEFQKGIIDFRDLHDTIIDMSSDFGLTNALESYCLGMQIVSTKEKDMNVSGKQIKNITSRIKFLYHKRRIYPGFDIHSVLINFAHQNALMDLKESLLKIATCDFEKLAEDKSKVLPPLKTLVSSIVNYIYEQRGQMTSALYSYMENELKTNKGKTIKKIVIITQGFSGAVNSCLFNILPISHETSALGQLLNGKQIYYYVLQSPSEVEDRFYSVSRYVRYKFKENPNIPDYSLGRVNVKVGDEDWLRKRFDRHENVKCYLITGAEIFQRQIDETSKDGEKKYKVRLINNEGTHNFESWGFAVEPVHIIIAEKFKELPRPLSSVDKEMEKNFRKAFNQDRLEYAHLYNWGERIVITGE